MTGRCVWLRKGGSPSRGTLSPAQKAPEQGRILRQLAWGGGRDEIGALTALPLSAVWDCPVSVPPAQGLSPAEGRAGTSLVAVLMGTSHRAAACLTLCLCLSWPSEGGSKDVPVSVPDTITEWKAGMFCTAEVGFGLSRTATFTAFKPFFVELALPYSVIRGEAFALKATVFNYLQQCIKVSAARG